MQPFLETSCTCDVHCDLPAQRFGRVEFQFVAQTADQFESAGFRGRRNGIVQNESFNSDAGLAESRPLSDIRYGFHEGKIIE